MIPPDDPRFVPLTPPLVTPPTPSLIVAADTRHLDALMIVMHASFEPGFGEAWSALQLGGTMVLDSSFARRALDTAGIAQGFTLCRSAGPEVELLLIAVTPAQRGNGMGRALLQTACEDARLRGAEEIFLEVRENNDAALALYRQSGFLEIGRRPNYYAGTTGLRYAALTMCRRLDNCSA
jgi:ribosomal-protein-alanine N-acetyltransferase